MGLEFSQVCDISFTFSILPVPISDKGRNLTYIFIFLLCSASKGFIKAFKAFIKPFKAPQRSVKIKISVKFLPSSVIGTGRIELRLSKSK